MDKKAERFLFFFFFCAACLLLGIVYIKLIAILCIEHIVLFVVY